MNSDSGGSGAVVKVIVEVVATNKEAADTKANIKLSPLHGIDVTDKLVVITGWFCVYFERAFARCYYFEYFHVSSDVATYFIPILYFTLLILQLMEDVLYWKKVWSFDVNLFLYLNLIVQRFMQNPAWNRNFS